MNKIKTVDELVPIVEELKNKGKIITTTNGCFDILHVGHIRYLNEAKKHGDILIVGVNSDSSTRLYKGDTRPVVNEKDRMEIISSLESVDYVFMFSEKNPKEWIVKLKPHIHVKGGDYTLDKIIEKDIVESNGGRVVLVSNVEGASTTNIIEKIRGNK